MMNQLRLHGTKYLGGLISALGVVAMTLTPEQLTSLLGAHGPGAVVIAAGVLTYLRGLQNSGQLPGGPPSEPKLHIATVILTALLAVGALSSCATFTPTQRITATLGIQYATAKFIESKPEADRAERAQKIVEIAQEVKTIADNDKATVDAMSGYVLLYISRAALTQADQVLANTLVAAVAEELKARVSQGILKPDERVAVLAVLDNIIAAAQAYVPDAPAA